jgi:hypothetical protein
MTVIQPAIQVCLQLKSRICPSDLVVTLTTTSPLLSFVLHSYLHLHTPHLTQRNPAMAQNEAMDPKIQPAEENTQSTPTPEARTRAPSLRVLAAAIVLLASFVIYCFLDPQSSPIHQLWYKFGPVPPKSDEPTVHVICGSPGPVRPPWTYIKHECLTVSSGGHTRG